MNTKILSQKFEHQWPRRIWPLSLPLSRSLPSSSSSTATWPSTSDYSIFLVLGAGSFLLSLITHLISSPCCWIVFVLPWWVWEASSGSFSWARHKEWPCIALTLTMSGCMWGWLCCLDIDPQTPHAAGESLFRHGESEGHETGFLGLGGAACLWWRAEDASHHCADTWHTACPLHEKH